MSGTALRGTPPSSSAAIAAFGHPDAARYCAQKRTARRLAPSFRLVQNMSCSALGGRIAAGSLHGLPDAGLTSSPLASVALVLASAARALSAALTVPGRFACSRAVLRSCASCRSCSTCRWCRCAAASSEVAEASTAGASTGLRTYTGTANSVAAMTRGGV